VTETPASTTPKRKPALPDIPPPGPIKYNFIRYGLRFFVGCYLRVRLENEHLLPQGEPYLICFSHPNWVDPMALVGYWPDRRWITIFGPREEDMTAGWRNRMILWSRMCVPFRPEKDDLLDTTRRAVRVLKNGYILGIAGEGRLSDKEGDIVPLHDGAAFFGLRAGVPIVPVAVIGTRWLGFGKTVRLRVGPPIPTAGRRADRATVAEVTSALDRAFDELLDGVAEDMPPGRFGRWLTDVFAERPWLNEQATTGTTTDSGGGPA
jgi:1-acyl-sn-glycerol-3-phosphate acyltransferase